MQDCYKTLAGHGHPWVGGRPWQCCVRRWQGRHCIPRMPFHRAGSSLQGAGERQSQCGEARGTSLKIHPPNLTFPGSKAKISSRSRRWNHQSRDQSAALGQEQQPQRKKLLKDLKLQAGI